MQEKTHRKWFTCFWETFVRNNFWPFPEKLLFIHLKFIIFEQNFTESSKFDRYYSILEIWLLKIEMNWRHTMAAQINMCVPGCSSFIAFIASSKKAFKIEKRKLKWHIYFLELCRKTVFAALFIFYICTLYSVRCGCCFNAFSPYLTISIHFSFSRILLCEITNKVIYGIGFCFLSENDCVDGFVWHESLCVHVFMCLQ